MRLPVEIVARVREVVGRGFIIICRLSMLDLIPDGSSWPEAVQLAKAITGAGATIINTGIDRHEAQCRGCARTRRWARRRARRCRSAPAACFASRPQRAAGV